MKARNFHSAEKTRGRYLSEKELEKLVRHERFPPARSQRVCTYRVPCADGGGCDEYVCGIGAVQPLHALS